MINLLTMLKTQDNFSHNEQIIVDYILDHPYEVVGMTTNQLCQKCYVSHATIYRLCAKMPIAGKDFKTGQTLVKSGFAPIIGTRCLGLSGWFSTNILGNRDGLVLDEPANFHTKEVSKLSTLESILVPEQQPDLYNDYYHKVRINYYPPRNDNKEGWDNIDIFGWMGYPMQIKINFLCRDSILAAPLCLDLVLLSDLAARAGRYGTQRFLSFFLKSPMHDYTQNEVPVNHLFQQYVMLKNALREMGGYEADEEID